MRAFNENHSDLQLDTLESMNQNHNTTISSFWKKTKIHRKNQ